MGVLESFYRVEQACFKGSFQPTGLAWGVGFSVWSVGVRGFGSGALLVWALGLSGVVCRLQGLRTAALGIEGILNLAA